MARLRSRSLTGVRRLLLALFAIGFVLRIGAGCETMAATPQTPAVHQHCADMPRKPGKPAKSEASACALCAALPSAPRTIAEPIAPTETRVFSFVGLTLAGRAFAPTPPPPRIA